MTTMADIGEKAYLAGILPSLGKHPRFINGFGDDASAISLPGGGTILFKIDRAAGPIASHRGWADYRLWGRLAVTSNCSDILAGGGEPLAVMIALVLPRDWKSADASDVIRGCAEECQAQDIAFAGGDTKEGKSPELIGTAIGTCETDQILTRRGAAPGDLIVVAGKVGGFLGSYLQFLDKVNSGVAADAPEVAPWLQYMVNPRARWAEGRHMNAERIPKGAMDTSDGLYDAVSVLTKEWGADIDLNALPHHPHALECAEELNIPLINMALGVGDWNIVYIVPQDRSAAIEQAHASGLDLTVIGAVSQEKGIRWHQGENVFKSQEIVNQHFSARFEDDDSTLIQRLRHENLLQPWSISLSEGARDVLDARPR